MWKDCQKHLLIILLFIGLTCVSVQAQPLYKWVDEHGVTHYSDARPDNSADVEALEFSGYPPVSDPQEDYYSIQNQLQRLQQWREASVKRKQQAAEIKAPHSVSPSKEYAPAEIAPRHYYLPAYRPHGRKKSYQYQYHPAHKRLPDRHHTHHKQSLPKTANHQKKGIVHHKKVTPSKATFSSSKSSRD